MHIRSISPQLQTKCANPLNLLLSVCGVGQHERIDFTGTVFSDTVAFSKQARITQLICVSMKIRAIAS